MPATLITLEEAARRLSISRRHLFELLQRPDFPRRVRLGARTIRLSETDLDEWISAQVPGRS